MLAALLEHLLEFVADIEVIFNRLLPAPGDDQDLIATRGHRFLDPILDDGLIDHRKHLFRLRFGRGQESGTKPGGGEHGFADSHRDGRLAGLLMARWPGICRGPNHCNCLLGECHRFTKFPWETSWMSVGPPRVAVVKEK